MHKLQHHHKFFFEIHIFLNFLAFQKNPECYTGSPLYSRLADPGLKAGAFSPGSVVPVRKPRLKGVSQLELMSVFVLVTEGVDGKGTKFLVKWHWIVLLSGIWHLWSHYKSSQFPTHH